MTVSCFEMLQAVYYFFCGNEKTGVWLQNRGLKNSGDSATR